MQLNSIFKDYELLAKNLWEMHEKKQLSTAEVQDTFKAYFKTLKPLEKWSLNKYLQFKFNDTDSGSAFA